MKLTYDRSVDAAYISFDPKRKLGYSVNTYSCDPLQLKGAQINLNFDSSYRLLGIEILDASNHLPKSFLKKAEIIG